MWKAPVAAIAMCWLVVGQTNTDDAIKRFQREIEANPKASRPHYQLGLIYLNDHNYQSAANEFRSALSGDLQPGLVVRQAHFELGLIFDITGQSDRAQNEYKLAGAPAFLDVLRPRPIKRVQVECRVDADGKA